MYNPPKNKQWMEKKYCWAEKDDERYEQRSYWFVQKSGSVSPTVLERADGKVNPIFTDSYGNINRHCNIRYS